MTPDEQSQYRAQTKEYLQGAIGEFANNYTNEHFSEAFSFFDILWGFLAIGAAFVTHAGKMKARHLIHVPNTDKPGGRVQVEDVLRATAAVLVACRVKGFASIAVPLMGAFDSGIPAEEAARAIHSELKAYRGDRPLKAYLMAKDADDVEVFELAMEGNIP